MPYSLSRYYNVRAARNPFFSPDSRTVYFVSDATGVPQLWSAGADGGLAQQRTFYDERIQEADCSPTDDRVVFGMDTGGDECQQLYLLAGSEVRPLTEDPSTIHSLGAWSPDGSAIAFSSNARNRAFFDIYVRRLEQPAPDLVYQFDGTHTVSAWSPDGRYLVLSRMVSLLDSELFLLDLQTGEAAMLTPGDEDSSYDGVAWTAGGLYLLTNHGREFVGLAHLDIASKELPYLHAPERDVEILAGCRETGALAWAINADGASEVAIWHPQKSPLPPAPTIVHGLPRGVASKLAWSAYGSWLAVALSSDCEGGEIWLVNALSGRAHRATRAARAGLPRRAFTESQLVHYPSFDGRTIPALLYLPPDAPHDGTLPMVIVVHGGPESQTRPNFNPLIQYLAHRGYGVLAPNVRGSTGYGRTYGHLDDKEKRPDAVMDVWCGAEWLVRSRYTSTSRLGVMGGSYGGFMTFAAITSFPETWGAAAAVCGIANFETFLQNTGPWRRQQRAIEYGDPDQDGDLLYRISPIHQVDRIRAPLMIVHGARDPRVPISEAEQMVDAVRSRGGVVDYLRFEDEGHGIVKRQNRIQAYTAITDFFDQHLRQPVPQPAQLPHELRRPVRGAGAWLAAVKGVP